MRLCFGSRRYGVAIHIHTCPFMYVCIHPCTYIYTHAYIRTHKVKHVFFVLMSPACRRFHVRRDLVVGIEPILVRSILVCVCVLCFLCSFRPVAVAGRVKRMKHVCAGSYGLYTVVAFSFIGIHSVLKQKDETQANPLRNPFGLRFETCKVEAEAANAHKPRNG